MKDLHIYISICIGTQINFITEQVLFNISLDVSVMINQMSVAKLESLWLFFSMFKICFFISCHPMKNTNKFLIERTTLLDRLLANLILRITIRAPKLRM